MRRRSKTVPKPDEADRSSECGRRFCFIPALFGALLAVVATGCSTDGSGTSSLRSAMKPSLPFGGVPAQSEPPVDSAGTSR